MSARHSSRDARVATIPNLVAPPPGRLPGNGCAFPAATARQDPWEPRSVFAARAGEISVPSESDRLRSSCPDPPHRPVNNGFDRRRLLATTPESDAVSYTHLTLPTIYSV